MKVKIIALKHKKHKKIVTDYERQKNKQLEKLATRMLKDDEKNTQLKEKTINTNFLNLF